MKFDLCESKNVIFESSEDLVGFLTSNKHIGELIHWKFRNKAIMRMSLEAEREKIDPQNCRDHSLMVF